MQVFRHKSSSASFVRAATHSFGVYTRTAACNGFPVKSRPGSRVSRNSPGCADDILAELFFTRNAWTTCGLSCGAPSLNRLVKRQRMATRARGRKLHRCHQFASRHRSVSGQYSRGRQEIFLAPRISGLSGNISRVSVRPICRCRPRARIISPDGRLRCLRPVTIPTFQLHVWPIGSAPNRFQMNRVIQLDRSGITRRFTALRAQRRKFRVSLFEALDMPCVALRADTFQITMARRATLVPCRNNTHSPTMLRVASGAAQVSSSAWRDAIGPS